MAIPKRRVAPQSPRRIVFLDYHTEIKSPEFLRSETCPAEARQAEKLPETTAQSASNLELSRGRRTCVGDVRSNSQMSCLWAKSLHTPARPLSKQRRHKLKPLRGQLRGVLGSRLSRAQEQKTTDNRAISVIQIA
jgi:hypothetical protein